jgi:flagellar basal-body rod protein FlgB
MKISGGPIFSSADSVLEQSLNHRLAKQNVIASNLTNAQTPGYRAMGYEFEGQLQAAMGTNGQLALHVSEAKHIKFAGAKADGTVQADLHVKPTESIGNDGNTVDADQEMADMAETQILYRATVELLNRKLGMLRYGINGGR